MYHCRGIGKVFPALAKRSCSCVFYTSPRTSPMDTSSASHPHLAPTAGRLFMLVHGPKGRLLQTCLQSAEAATAQPPPRAMRPQQPTSTCPSASANASTVTSPSLPRATALTHLRSATPCRCHGSAQIMCTQLRLSCMCLRGDCARIIVLSDLLLQLPCHQLHMQVQKLCVKLQHGAPCRSTWMCS